MPAPQTFPDLEAAVRLYFDVLYDCDLAKFDALFHPTCNLYTVQDGKETVTPLSRYREIIATRQSPASVGQPREERLEAILTLSDEAALVVVAVRIHDNRYRDHLGFIRGQDGWRIASKIYVRA